MTTAARIAKTVRRHPLYSDMTLEEWQRAEKDPGEFIFQATWLPPQIPLQPWLIGMGPGFHLLSREERVAAQVGGAHDKTFHLAFRTPTDATRRPTAPNRASCAALFARHGVANRTPRAHLMSEPPSKTEVSAFYADLGRHKFVVSPEGFRKDCFRHAEAIYCGAIPIVEHDPHIETLYEGLPVVYTKDGYADVAGREADFEALYSKMLKQRFDFSRLFRSCYSDDDQALMERQANYWVGQCLPSAPPPYPDRR